jgi:hypothetical protein
LLYMIYLVCLVKQDQLDEQIKPDELDRPGLSQTCRPLSFHRDTIVFSQPVCGGIAPSRTNQLQKTRTISSQYLSASHTSAKMFGEMGLSLSTALTSLIFGNHCIQMRCSRRSHRHVS